MGLKSIKDLRGLTANDMTRYAGLYYRACILVKYGQVPRSSRAAEPCFDTTAKYHQVDDVPTNSMHVSGRQRFKKVWYRIGSGLREQGIIECTRVRYAESRFS